MDNTDRHTRMLKSYASEKEKEKPLSQLPAGALFIIYQGLQGGFELIEGPTQYRVNSIQTRSAVLIREGQYKTE